MRSITGAAIMVTLAIVGSTAIACARRSSVGGAVDALASPTGRAGSTGAVSALSAAAGSGTVPAPHIPRSTGDDFRYVQDLAPSPDWQAIPVTAAVRLERLRWLAKDFGSRAFLTADGVEEARLQTRLSNEPVHLGVITLHFAGCTQLAAARQAVARAGRYNFRLPVLTVFRLRSNAHQLTFAMSETPLARTVENVFKVFDSATDLTAPCTD